MNEIEGLGVSAVTRTVTVHAPIERSFEVFTAGFDRWWPRSHRAGEAEIEDVILEARPGGRWVERRVDGTEQEWGQVLECEPPHRVVLSWYLNGDPERATEIEVRFTAVGPATTRVVVEHRHLDLGGEAARHVYAIAGVGGWSSLLAHYAAKIDW